MAKQILATPVSTIVVEQEFSASDNILDANRLSMSPDLIEAQDCLNDWTKVEFQQLELDEKPMYEYFKNDQTMRTKGSND